MNYKLQLLIQGTICLFTLFFSGVLLFLSYQNNEHQFYKASAFGAILVVQVAFFLYQLKFIWLPLKKATGHLSDLSKGRVPEITASQRVSNKLFVHLQRIGNQFIYLTTYAKNLNGINENDFSKKEVHAFRHSLKKIDYYIKNLKRDAEDWKSKEEKRTWANQGIARFSDLLRNNYNSLNDLSQEMLRQLIKYVKANQGGVFLVDGENNNKLSMVAAYAYDRDKYPDKSRSMDDGLLGAVCFERQPIFMTKIPDNYLDIRSGMGEAPPSCLFLVPLLSDGKVIGVVELASFNQFQEHERAFIEKIAESLASTIASVQINQTTSRLLEQSQKQAQELKNSEEELRQNIEEMKTQQEEMEKKQFEVEESKSLMSKIVDLVPYPIFVKDKKRRYIVANKAQAELFNMRSDDLLGKTDNDLINQIEELNEILKTDMEVLNENQLIKLPEQSISLPNGARKIMQTIKVPFVNNITNNRNILGVSIDYTQQRNLEHKLKKSQQEIEDLSQRMDEGKK